MKKTAAIVITTFLSASLLSACSTSKELERIPFCKSIVENIVGKSLAWSTAEENNAGIALEVAVTSEEHVASCIYDKIDREGQMEEKFESAPTSVIIDGNEIDASTLIKATAAVTGKAAKKAAKEVADEAGKAAEKAKEAAGKAGEAAKDLTGKALDAAKEQLNQ